MDTASDNPSRPALLRTLLIALVVVAGIWAVVVQLTPGLGEEADRLQDVVEISAGVLALVVGVLMLVRYRWAAEGRSLWLGAGMFALGAGRLAPEIAAAVVPPDLLEPATLELMRFAGRSVALMTLFVATGGPAMTAAAQMRRAVTATAGIVLVNVVAYTTFDLRGELFIEDPALGAGSLGHLVVAGLLTVTWVALGVTFLRSGFQLAEPLPAWLGTSFLILGLAQALTLPIEGFEPLAEVDIAVLRGGAFACALIGVISELRRLYAIQLSLREQAEVEAGEIGALARQEREAYDTLRHEARNALQAVDAGIHTIERSREALRPEDVAALEHAIQAEVSRLQRMLGPRAAAGTVVSFPLADAVRPAVAAAKARGADVRWEESDAVVRGRPDDVSQIVHNLIQNALRHAPGSPVFVELHTNGASAMLRVTDCGPGVPAADREAVFERGFRREGSEGAGVGLAVSRELATAQGGELVLEEQADPGACFRLALPLAST